MTTLRIFGHCLLWSLDNISLFREANQLSEEMGKETEFAVTLQVRLLEAVYAFSAELRVKL